MSTATDLREVLHDHLDPVPVPVGDLAAVRERGRRLRRRRRSAALAAGSVAAAVVVGGLALVVGGDESRGGDSPIEPVGALDLSEGLRAYADPGFEIHLGGRSFPADRLGHLDTEGAATPFGVVFYADGVPFLLGEDGESVPLEEGEGSGLRGFRPTAHSDSRNPWVVYGTVDGDGVRVTVRDLALDEVVARRTVECADDCADVAIDGLDDGRVLVRTASGTSVWDTRDDSVTALAGPATRVADLRGGVVLHSGPRPDGPAAGRFRLVEGPVDATLTFDGGHVLDWSSTLRPTRPGGSPIELEQGPLAGEDGLAWWAFDTDGSVLVAAVEKYPRTTVYDCEVPSGACTELGPLTPQGGDPAFIGADM